MVVLFFPFVVHINSSGRLKNFWFFLFIGAFKYMVLLLFHYFVSLACNQSVAMPSLGTHVYMHPKATFFSCLKSTSVKSKLPKNQSLFFFLCDSKALLTAVVQGLAHLVAGPKNKQKQDNCFSGFSVLSDLSMGSFALSRHSLSALAARRSWWLMNVFVLTAAEHCAASMRLMHE